MQPEDDSSRPASLVTPPRRAKPASPVGSPQDKAAAPIAPRRIAGEADLLAAEAQLLRARIENDADPTARESTLAEAEALEADAAKLRDPVACGLPELYPGHGGEISPLPDNRMPYNLDAVAQAVQAPPATLAAEATVDRLNLALEAGVLTLAVEAATAMGAQDPVQRMLCHQMTAVHKVTMQLCAMTERQAQFHQGQRALERGGAALVDAARNAMAIARLVDSYSRAALTLDRLQNGGRQSVTVQHVVVGEGGQAVVAANLDTADQATRPRKRR